MENSQLKDLQEEVSEATKQYILTTFNSENGMKTYYLQMSNIIRSAHINPPIDTEYNSLKKLSKSSSNIVLSFKHLVNMNGIRE